MFERAKEASDFTQEKLKLAKEFFEKNNLNETIHYVWVVFENCTNIIKDIKNQTPLQNHKSKVDLLNLYFHLGILKYNYSHHFERLEKFRLRANFGDYALAPKIPDKEIVEDYLNKAKELFGEIKGILNEHFNLKTKKDLSK